MLLVFLLKGIVVGIVIAVPVGPVGVMCVRRTIFEGKLAGFVSGLGAATADAVFGFIAAFGLTFVSDWLIGYQQWLRVVGGCYLLYVGGSALLAEPEAKSTRNRDAEGLLRDFPSTFVADPDQSDHDPRLPRHLLRARPQRRGGDASAAPQSWFSGCGSARCCGGWR